MSRYAPQDYRGPRDRSRSPPRFPDRRASSASIFDPRPPGPPRTASDAPRGPRSQFDGLRPPQNNGTAATPGSRTGYTSLRDAPPLGSGDRGRPYREREYDRRDRPASPRDRSPARSFLPKDARDYSPRDLDIRARRESRDGPLSAGSNYSDGQALPSSASSRGALSRGRGRGDFSFRGGRGGRSNLDERDLFRRERSPPPRWPAEPPRDGRDPERREDRRFERREDDRKPSDWSERERERDVDRGRRDPVPPRIENRTSSDSIPAVNSSSQAPQPPHVNPERLALIERAAADTPGRRSSMQQDAYINGRAEITANRYGSGGSSPPTQAPPVPAFTLSFAPAPSAPAPSSQPPPSTQATQTPQEPKATVSSVVEAPQAPVKTGEERKLEPPPEAPIAPRMPPAAPKAQLVSPPPAAPRAPRAHDFDDSTAVGSRLQGVRSLETLSAPSSAPTGPGLSRAEPSAPMRLPSTSVSPAVAPALPTLVQPVSPGASQAQRFAELNPPTGPRASRMSPAQASVSPRPPFASPRAELVRPSGVPRMQTPPPSAPSGPRNRSYSISPKVANSSVPTEPKANRGPPIAPRGPERGPMAPARAPERLAAPSPWAPPSAPRGQPLWNQWRRPAAPVYGDKTVPAKRDMLGEEKVSSGGPIRSATSTHGETTDLVNSENYRSKTSEPALRLDDRRRVNDMDVDRQPPRRQSSMMTSHSAARSFFGKPAEGEDEDSAVSDTAQEPPSTSEDDESDMENDLALFNAKFERQKRQLEAQMVDLSTRHYRATTPLENLARLARISARDLEKFNEQRTHEMDLDRSPIARKHHILPPTRHSSDSGDGPDIVTPKDDDDRRVAIRSSDESSDGIRRMRRPSPEPVNLPYLVKDTHMRFGESDLFQESLQRHEESKADILHAMEDELRTQDESEVYVEDVFAHEYRKWKEECEHLDRLKEEQERLERQQSFEPKPEVDAPSVAPINPIFEGRRLHKFSSEYEIEQVLKQSEETARIEQERQDREARKNQADMEKEAKIPDQLTEDEIARGIFLDTNRYRDPESLTLVFSYQPPPDDFTENEQHIFIAAFKETPKKWGEIASLLPGRNYQDCIRHYYANKWDGRFRDHRTKKLKMGGRRGRGGAKGPRGRVGGLMADLRVEDFLGPENVNDKGRPRRAAAPTTFAEKEAEAKANLLGPSPAKKPGAGSKAEANGDTGSEKPGKRQKRTGEKPGRKTNKPNPPLAALAAAPHGSPGSQFQHGIHSQEDLADASLLASLHGGHHGAPPTDRHVVYHSDGYMQAMPPLSEEAERPRAGGQGQAAKQGASSYWSVPEQNDFVKYIGHFGRDFAAIAAHMGTKTQTMIKNHYQRQVDGGNRPELERAAIEADDRKARGEELGPPPTPTPIQKRKYENPPAPAQRALAPQAEAGETDDSGPPQRLQAPKQGSPPQYQPQPRFTTSIQNTSIPAPRVGPSPLITSTVASTSLPATSHSRPMQHSFGSRFTFLPETRSEVRPPAQPVPGYRASQGSPKQSQPPPQQSRTVADARDPQFLSNLAQEQDRAMRLERQQTQQGRIEQLQRQPAMQRNPSQGSPPNPPQQIPPDRKPISEERAPSPPRGSTFAPPNIARHFFGSGNFPPLSTTSMSPLTGRSAFNPSPPKREDSRSDIFSSAPSAQPSTTTPIATPTEPKRSNVMSLLNSEPEEPRQPKRDSLPSAPPRTASPAQLGYAHVTAATPLPGVPAPKREPSFGQPSMPQSHFHRGSFGHQSSTSTPASHSHKHEPSPGSGSSSQPAKSDWAARVLGQTSQPSPPTPTLERDGRSYLHHRQVLGSLGTTRINPSPPPLSGNPHSRTPSLSGQAGQSSREQPREPARASLSGPQPVQPLQPNPYATPSQTSFSHHQTPQAQNKSHHSQNSSHSGPFPSFHQRSISRDDYPRQEPPRQEQIMSAVQRERDEQDLRWRQQRGPVEIERRRDRDEQYMAQQQQELERERQQGLHRAPPQPLQPPPYSSGAFGPSSNLDLRSRSRVDSEMAMREERERQQQDFDRRRQEDFLREENRRRLEEPLLFRQTALGRFGAPQPGPRR